MYLCVKGVQDEWVTKCPDYSHFIYTFRQHTPFGIDFSDIPFTANPDFGEILTVRIPSTKSDLLNSVSLTVEWRADYDAMTTVANPITKLIEYAELTIGEQVIDRISGEYIYLRNKLDTSEQHKDIGLYRGGEGSTSGGYYPTKFSLELPFYFTRNNKSAIPLCKLTKQQVTVRVKLVSREKYYSYKSTASNLPPIDDSTQKFISKMFLTTEHVYLGEMERKAFQNNHMEYLITQVQQRDTRLKEGNNKKVFLLDLKHPVKEFLFLGEPMYTNSNDTRNNYRFRQIKNAELCLNNVIFFRENGHFLSVVQPFKNHVNIPDVGESQFGMYSFSLDPGDSNPTGQLNMSRIIHQKFTIEFKEQDRYVDLSLPENPQTRPYSSEETQIRVYAINYNILSFDSGLAGLKFY
jgi:hypothetical protein